MRLQSIDKLRQGACLYWPPSLLEQAALISSLGPLIETQEIFLSVLKTADKSPQGWEFVVAQSDKLSPNLFLKHLMVLSDIGGEKLQRFFKDKENIFPLNKIVFLWKNKEHSYIFSGDNNKAWNNKNLYVDKSVLLSKIPAFTNEMRDVCMLILYAGLSTDISKLPAELVDKCTLGNLIGYPDALEVFIKQRYIAVSKITGGSAANDLGHICEKYIGDWLEKNLPESIVVNGHNIEGIYNGQNLITFDLVAKNMNTLKCVGIEISFQVTTNSTIERKAGQAKFRKETVNNAGHKIAYVIDGAGNFERKSAISEIINSSDFVSNFSNAGLKDLVNFIIEATSD